MRLRIRHDREWIQIRRLATRDHDVHGHVAVVRDELGGVSCGTGVADLCDGAVAGGGAADDEV